MFAPTRARSSATPIAEYLSSRKLSAPIIVGGVGGSGTRLVVQILLEIGVFMGTTRNVSEDAMPFVTIYDDHINPYLSGNVDRTSLVEQVLRALRLHVDCGEKDRVSLWGWKNPRTIYLLPLLDELFDGMRFIHVVRDGIAMATSENQAQLEKHGPSVLPQKFQGLSKYERALVLWSLVNNAAAEYGKLMGKRYLMVRYEDICSDPATATVALASALGIPHSNHSRILAHAPRVRDVNLTFKIEGEAASMVSDALSRFGYPC